MDTVRKTRRGFYLDTGTFRKVSLIKSQVDACFARALANATCPDDAPPLDLAVRTERLQNDIGQKMGYRLWVSGSFSDIQTVQIQHTLAAFSAMYDALREDDVTPPPAWRMRDLERASQVITIQGA